MEKRNGKHLRILTQRLHDILYSLVKHIKTIHAYTSKFYSERENWITKDGRGSGIV